MQLYRGIIWGWLNNVRSTLKKLYLENRGYASGKEFTNQFIKDAVAGVAFLDGGSGEGKLRKLLPKGVLYVGIDKYFGENSEGYEGWKHKPDIIADLHALPLQKNSFEVVVLLHVLEHVHSPERVMKEMQFVMKKKGKLYLAVPFIHELHHCPHDYFRFTKHGLEFLIRSAGLDVLYIKPTGGYHRCLHHILLRHKELFVSQSLLKKIIVFPLAVIIFFLYVIFKILEYPLDLLDKNQELTCGYICVAQKIKEC